MAITVWLALKNLNGMTAMKVISRSHRLPVHPAQLRSSYGLDTSDDDAVVKSARELDSTCELNILDAKPGEFFIFSGRVWHSIQNRSQHPRSAIIFQYSPTRAKVKMPATGYQFRVEWDSRRFHVVWCGESTSTEETSSLTYPIRVCQSESRSASEGLAL